MNAEMNTASDLKRDLLRHTVATLAYRGGKAVLNAPDGFATSRVNDTTRTPERFWRISAICSTGRFVWRRANMFTKNLRRCLGKKESRGSSLPSKLLILIWLQKHRWDPLLRKSCRDQSPMS